MQNTAYIQIGNVQLKAGDKVAIEEGYHNLSYILGTIKRITPTGQVVVQAGSVEYRFNADGHEIGGASFRRRSLVPVTDDIQVTIMRRRIAAYKWEKVNLETVMQIARILGLVDQQGE